MPSNHNTNVVDWFGNRIQGSENYNARQTTNGTYGFYDTNGGFVGMGFDPEWQKYNKGLRDSGTQDSWLDDLLTRMYGTANPTQGSQDWLKSAGQNWYGPKAGAGDGGVTPGSGLLSGWQATGGANTNLESALGVTHAPLQNLGLGANPNYQGQATIGTGNADLLAQRLAKIRGGA